METYVLCLMRYGTRQVGEIESLQHQRCLSKFYVQNPLNYLLIPVFIRNLEWINGVLNETGPKSSVRGHTVHTSIHSGIDIDWLHHIISSQLSLASRATIIVLIYLWSSRLHKLALAFAFLDHTVWQKRCDKMADEYAREITKQAVARACVALGNRNFFWRVISTPNLMSLW